MCLFIACNNSEQTKVETTSPITGLSVDEYNVAKSIGVAHNVGLDKIIKGYNSPVTRAAYKTVEDKLNSIKEDMIVSCPLEDQIIITSSIDRIDEIYKIEINEVKLTGEISQTVSVDHYAFLCELENNDITTEAKLIQFINSKEGLSAAGIYNLSLLGYTFINSFEYWNNAENMQNWADFYQLNNTSMSTRGFWGNLWKAAKKVAVADAAGAGAVLIEAGVAAATGVGAPIAAATVASGALYGSVVGCVVAIAE